MDTGRVARFTRTERTLHWVHAAAFLVLLVTGLMLYVPSLSELVGRRTLLKDVHVYTAVAWVAALALVVAVGDRRAVGRTLREIDLFDADDRGWLLRHGNPQGRFNAGQKLNAILSAAFALLFAVTGFFLWLGERDTRFRLPNALLVHDWLTLASLTLFLGHLYLAVLYPQTRHALNGMTRGWVREDWARAHHAKWVEQMRRRGAP
jgi:formate dehydrogenase subunit gamma